MKENQLLEDLVKVASENPELREQLLPVITKNAERMDPFYRTFPKLFKDIAGKLQPVNYSTFKNEMRGIFETDPDTGRQFHLIDAKTPGAKALRRQKFEEWKAPRVAHNRKIIVTYVARNTKNRVQHVKRTLLRDVKRSAKENPGLNRLYRYILVATGYAQDMKDAAVKLVSSSDKPAANLKLASELRMRSDLVKLAAEDPTYAAEIYDMLLDD